ncbi:MAG: hypothetical protein ACI9S8_001330 [Chlamydiales bacterium]|jgi:hypothetical protein
MDPNINPPRCTPRPSFMKMFNDFRHYTLSPHGGSIIRNTVWTAGAAMVFFRRPIGRFPIPSFLQSNCTNLFNTFQSPAAKKILGVKKFEDISKMSESYKGMRNILGATALALPTMLYFDWKGRSPIFLSDRLQIKPSDI